MSPIPDDYVPVNERIAEFRAKHPEGSLQPADLANPYRVEIVGDKAFIVFVAAAYRTPDDQRPGIGTAWEPFPGPTNFTRNSELQNAETSAWGRAIVACLAADTKRGIATAEDVRNREGEKTSPPPKPAPAPAAPSNDDQARDVEVKTLLIKHRKSTKHVREICEELQGEGTKVPDLSPENFEALKERLSAAPQSVAS